MIDKMKRYFLPSLLIVVTYMWLGPLEVYFGNTKDFNFGFNSFLWILLGLGLAVVAVFCIVGCLLPKKIGIVVNIMLTWFGVASYIQNMFLNRQLSQDNGAPMDWTTVADYTKINLLIWIGLLLVVLLVFWRMRKNWDMIASALCGFLCAIQLVAVLSLVVPAMINGSENTDAELGLSGDKQYQIAQNHNVIVFVIDTFGSQQIDEIKKVYPDALNGFEDFTLYTNADCTFYCTFPSMTHLFTGSPLDFDTSDTNDWLKESWESDRCISFFDELHKKGYQCNLYAEDIGYVYGNILNLAGKWDNVQPAQKVVNTAKTVKLLLKISAYRFVPYILKPQLEVLTMDFSDVVSYENDCIPLVGNATFYSGLQENGLQIDPDIDNAFIIEHLFGTHQPYTTSADGLAVEESTSQDVGKAILMMIQEYITDLKQLGAYDNSTIIIMGDHGRWHGSDPQPVFMVKEVGEVHDEMQLNNAPISYMDFQATIMTMIGSDASPYGTPIYDWNEGDTRERTVYMRQNDDDMPDVKGSSYNAYYGYTYNKDKNELLEIIDKGPTVIKPATPW